MLYWTPKFVRTRWFIHFMVLEQFFFLSLFFFFFPFSLFSSRLQRWPIVGQGWPGLWLFWSSKNGTPPFLPSHLPEKYKKKLLKTRRATQDTPVFTIIRAIFFSFLSLSLSCAGSVARHASSSVHPLSPDLLGPRSSRLRLTFAPFFAVSFFSFFFFFLSFFPFSFSIVSYGTTTMDGVTAR